mgnify:FL=1
MSNQLEGHLNTFLVNGGVNTVATTASTAADASGDQRDENIRGIDNLRIDIDALNKTVSDLVAKLRSNNLIQS